MYFLTSLLDPDPDDGGSQPKDGGGGRLPAAQPLSPLSLKPALMAPQDVNAERETDSSKQEKSNETAQSNEELQSSGSAEQGGSETTQGGQNTNSLQVEEEEKHAIADKHNQHDGNEEIQDPCEGNKTTKSSEDKTLREEHMAGKEGKEEAQIHSKRSGSQNSGESTTTPVLTGSEEAESGQDTGAPLTQTKNVDDNRNETEHAGEHKGYDEKDTESGSELNLSHTNANNQQKTGHQVSPDERTADDEGGCDRKDQVHHQSSTTRGEATDDPGHNKDSKDKSGSDKSGGEEMNQ